MSLSSLVLPPQLSKDTSYENYKKELEIWKLLKACGDEEQGPIVFRQLTGDAKKAALELTPDEIGAKDGLAKIIAKLDKLYDTDNNQKICATLEKFESFKRSSTMTMSAFILEFEQLHNQLKKYGCTYPDGVLAFRLMKNANMSPEHERLCRATIETNKWSYAAVQQQIKKIFNYFVAVKHDSDSSSANDRPLPIKVEETYLAQESYDENYNYDDVRAIHYEDYANEEEILPNSEPLCPQYGDRDPEVHDIYYGPSRNSQGSWRWNAGRRNQGGRYQDTWRFTPGQQRYQRQVSPPSLNEPVNNPSNNSTKPNLYAMNPRDHRGNPTVCRKCRSFYHYWENCPHVTPMERKNASKQRVYYNQNNREDLFIALFQKSSPTTSEEITLLMEESMNMALIDSGCTKSCCGKKWLDAYLETLNKEEVAEIQNKESNAVFKFGDSPPVHALHSSLVPLKVEDVNFMLKIEVVPSDIPLLLSKETMKTAKAKINFVEDKIELFGREVPMTCTSSGHYAIPVTKSSPSSIVMLADQDIKDKKSVAKKLHTQFCHPSAKRLIGLVESAGKGDAELKKAIHDVTDRCDVCKIHKKPSPKPVVSFPMASEFNGNGSHGSENIQEQ